MMRETAKKLLKQHDSYIFALEDAVQLWRNAENLTKKAEYMLVIGEIGNGIYRMNKYLDLKNFSEELENV